MSKYLSIKMWMFLVYRKIYHTSATKLVLSPRKIICTNGTVPNPVTAEFTEELLAKFRLEMNKTCSEKSSDKPAKVQKVKVVEADASGDKNIQKLEKERNILLSKIENIDKAIEAYKTYQKLMQNI